MNMKKMLIVIQLLGTSSLGVAQETPTTQKTSTPASQEYSSPSLQERLNKFYGRPRQSPVAATAQPKKRVQSPASLPLSPLITPEKKPWERAQAEQQAAYMIRSSREAEQECNEWRAQQPPSPDKLAASYEIEQQDILDKQINNYLGVSSQNSPCPHNLLRQKSVHLDRIISTRKREALSQEKLSPKKQPRCSERGREEKFPLHAAISSSNKNLVEKLIVNHADLLEKNDRGLTPLELAEKIQKDMRYWATLGELDFDESHNDQIIAMLKENIAQEPISAPVSVCRFLRNEEGESAHESPVNDSEGIMELCSCGPNGWLTPPVPNNGAPKSKKDPRTEK